MKQIICFVFIILQVIIATVKANGYYTIVAPGTIQSDYAYDVTVTVHEHHVPATIRVGITGPSYNESQTVDINPTSAEIVHFDVPTLESGEYELQCEGLSGLIFKQHTKLQYKNELPKVYIQTDKAQYKPGDLVKYRILALDESLKPAKNTRSLTLGIEDGAKNKIKQIKEMKFKNGVHSGEFQLSDQPVLGDWKMEVTIGKEHKSKATKKFEVAKYVLPKFSVELETDKQVAIIDRVVKITVRSKYTYGKPVKGKATVKASIENHGGGYSPGPRGPFAGPPAYNPIHPGTSMPRRPGGTSIPHSPQPETLKAEKTIDINGRGQIEFDFMEDLQIDLYNGYNLPQIHIEAVMQEALTGLEQNTTTTIDVVSSRYTITVPKMKTTYETNIPFEITAIIKKLNGSPVTDARSTAKLFVSHQSNYGYGYGYGYVSHGSNGHELMYEAEVNNMGVAVFQLKFSRPMYYHNIKIMYEEKVHNMHGFNVQDPGSPTTPKIDVGFPQPYQPHEYIGDLKLFPKNKNPELGEEVIIDVKSEHSIPYFVYTVMVRGKILKHEYVKVEADKKCVCIKIKPTSEMAPIAKVFVYFVKDGELKSYDTTINIPSKFENKLEISAPEQVKPGDEVTLDIKTDPDSYVGLLGVDQSVLLLQGGNDFDEKQITVDLGSYDSQPNWSAGFNQMPGRAAGFVTLTNACYPRYETRSGGMGFSGRPGVAYAMPQSASASYAHAAPGMPGGAMLFDSSPNVMEAVPIQPKLRKDFVESWIFDSIESTDAKGLAKFTKKVPDTITSWVITGFTLNDHSGFGTSENATKIRAFQPFFLSTNLPYSIKRGEVVTIPVTIFNYMETETEAQITMDNEYSEFDFTDAFSDDMEVAYNDNQRTKTVLVQSNSGETVYFTIRPNIVGEISLMIKAITSVAGDAILQKLKVEPEGVTHFKNEAFFITIPEATTVEHTLKALIPADVVLDSEHFEFTAVGDILGPTIKNIDQLVRMPYGCGEQNMVNFVPNILVLHYLDVIKADMPSVVEKAKSYMEKGYQRELTYKHKNGAYSAFGEHSSEANSWLTAYVARSFIQARKYITISGSVINEALKYLISTQKPNGQFPQTGKLFHSTNQNEVGVSAFIMLALLEDPKYALKHKSTIDKGLQYLIENIEREDDIYTLSLVALVFQKVKHSSLGKLVEKLKLKSNYENNLKWWGKSSKKSYSNNNIEVTAYVLQTLLESEEAGDILPVIKWLIGQRNSLGGFDSTQDTVVGLQALISFAEKYAAGGSGTMTISFEAQNEDGREVSKGRFEMNKDNSLLLQSYVVPRSSRQLTLSAVGQGSALVQLAYHYNMASENDQPSFIVKHSVKPSLYPGQLNMNVCAEYKPLASDDDDDTKPNESNMAVMEINLPSGYTTDDDSLKSIRDVEQIQRVETKNDDSSIVVYFDSLIAGQPICLDINADKSHAVAKLKPAAITVYDYYNTNERATVYYEVKSSLCDICEKEECGKGCKIR